jgi:hypothetical protein
MDLGMGLLAGGLGLIGSSQARSAAKDAAAAQIEAAKIAADAAAFKPYSVTTGLGSSYFNPETQTAGYTLDPALEAWRDQMMTMGAQALPQSMDTAANAQQYYNEIQGMMAPQRQAENLQMQQDLFGSGRLGMRLAGEGAGAGTGMVQPDVFGLNQARSQADQALAQQARTQAQTELDQAIARGTGLFQTGVGIEQLGLTPLELGGTFGGYGSSAGSAQANALLQGGMGAAQANLAAGMNSANMFGSLGANLLKYNKPAV